MEIQNSGRKLKEDVVQKLVNEFAGKGNESEMANKLRQLTLGTVDGIRQKIFEYYVDQCVEAIEVNENENYTGNAHEVAREKALSTFCEEKNIIKDKLTEGEEELFEEYFMDNSYTFCQAAYDDVGIDENLDDEILRSAIEFFEEHFNCGAGISDYFYWHFTDDIWVNS